MTLREQILGIPIKTRTAIEVPEWGTTVYAATISAKRQVEMAPIIAKYGDEPASAVFVAFGVEDDNGDLIFTPDDIPRIAQMPASIVTKLAAAVQGQDQSEAIAKNS